MGCSLKAQREPSHEQISRENTLRFSAFTRVRNGGHDHFSGSDAAEWHGLHTIESARVRHRKSAEFRHLQRLPDLASGAWRHLAPRDPNELRHQLARQLDRSSYL